jgi:MATE family multidrug resistance protein
MTVSRKLVSQIYELAWPVLIAQLAVMAYAVIDTLMAGRYATEDLAAVGIGASIYISVFVGLMGVLLAVTPTVAQLLGARREGEIGEQVRQAMWLALVLAVVSVAIFSYPDPLLRLSEAPPAVERKVRAYLSIAAWGAPAGLAFRLFASYTTAVSQPRVMMTLNLLGLALKMPLNWMFIFGHWGAPEMGAAGCALATALVSWLICGMAWVRVGTSSTYRAHGVFAQWSWPRWRDQRHLLALGLPIGGTFLVDVTAFTFMALFVARLGAVTSAAHQIAANAAAVMYMLPLATANAVGVLVGQAIGARNFAQARSTGLTGLALGLAVALTTATLLALCAARVAAFYTPDADVQVLAASLLVLVAGYHLFDAMQAVMVNALRGYKRAVVPLVVNAAGLWAVGLGGGVMIGLGTFPLARALRFQAPLGVRGFWLAAMVGMAIATLGIVIYFLVVSAPHRMRTRGEAAVAVP